MGAHPTIPILSFSHMISTHDFGYACHRHLGSYRAQEMIVRTIRDDPHTSILFSIGDRDIIQLLAEGINDLAMRFGA